MALLPRAPPARRAPRQPARRDVEAPPRSPAVPLCVLQLHSPDAAGHGGAVSCGPGGVMRLAGQIRLKAFLTLGGAILAVTAIAVIGGVTHYLASRPAPPPPPLEAPTPVAVHEAPVPAPASGLRAVDEVVLGYH